MAASYFRTLYRSARAVHPFILAKVRRGRQRLARRSRVRTGLRVAHPSGPSPPRIFLGRAIGASHFWADRSATIPPIKKFSPTIIWHETFLPLSTPHPLPSCAGVERRLQAFAPRNRDGVRGRPPLWPAADPVAQSVACVRPVVSPPVRRPDVRGCSPSSVADRTFRRFGRACQAPVLKPAAQGWTAFIRYWAVEGEAAKTVSWSGAGGQRPVMWVFDAAFEGGQSVGPAFDLPRLLYPNKMGCTP